MNYKSKLFNFNALIFYYKLTSIRRNQKDSWSVINENSKGRNALPPTPKVQAVGEHIKFNKTTERKSSQRKASFFYDKRRLDFNQKVENDSQITNSSRTDANLETVKYFV